MNTYTSSFGSPVNYTHAAQRVSTNGPLLLQGCIILSFCYPFLIDEYTDFHTVDNLAHLARERIPERIVGIIHSDCHSPQTPTSRIVGPCQGCWRLWLLRSHR